MRSSRYSGVVRRDVQQDFSSFRSVGKMKIPVAIVGVGPTGLMLAHILNLEGIDSIVVEKHPREYVSRRNCAGVLKAGSVKLLRDVGLGERMGRGRSTT